MNKKNVLINVGIGVAGLGVGFTAGWIVRTKQANNAIRKIAGELEEEYKDQVARVTKTGPYATIESAHEAVLQQSAEEADISLPEVQEEPETDDTPVVFEDRFTDFPEEKPVIDAEEFARRFNNRVLPEGGITYPGQDDDEDKPVSSVPGFTTVRDPYGPYLISIDEYLEQEDDHPFTKLEMTYYTDDVLLDIDDKEVPDIEGTIGRKNLSRFGEGTTDPSQMYIRNERLEIDIEVTRDDGTYVAKLLHQDPDPVEKRKVGKFRTEDDGD